MLQEFQGGQQEKGAVTHRRWFQDAGMDLILWYAPDKRLAGFQICYLGEDQRERALTWRDGEGFSHARVDSGDSRPDKNLTPILVQDGAVPWQRIQADFAGRALQLDPAVRDGVLSAFARHH